MPRFDAFAEEYLRRCGPHFKPSGLRTVRIYLKARLAPAFGKMPLDPENLEQSAFKVEDPDGITIDVSEVTTAWPGTTLHPNQTGPG